MFNLNFYMVDLLHSFFFLSYLNVRECSQCALKFLIFIKRRYCLLFVSNETHRYNNKKIMIVF